MRTAALLLISCVIFFAQIGPVNPGGGGGGGSATPAAPAKSLQYNNTGALGGATLLYDSASGNYALGPLGFDPGITPANFATQIAVSKNAASDPYAFFGVSEGIVSYMYSTTPDASLSEMDSLNGYAVWVGTSAPGGPLTLVGTSGYGYVGDYFTHASGDATQVAVVQGGYFAGGCQNCSGALPLAEAAFFSVDNLSHSHGGTGTITEGRLAYFHGGDHTGVTSLYGIYMDDMTGATNNWSIRTGTGKVELGDLLNLDPHTLAAISALVPVDGSTAYCSDCTVTSGIDDTCAGSGTGASVVRVNGVLRCRI